MEHHKEQSPEVAMWLDAVQLHEAPWLYTRWAALSAASAQAGRKVFVYYMFGELHANMYLLWVAPPAARKSTVFNYVAAMLRDAGHINFCPSDLTKVGFLRALHSGEYRKRQESHRVQLKQTREEQATLRGMHDELMKPFGSPSKVRGKVLLPKSAKHFTEDDIIEQLSADVLEDLPDDEGSPMTIYTNELQVMFPRQSQDVFALLQDLYDGKSEFTGRDAIIKKPYVTMLALVNPEALPTVFPNKSLLAGLMSRLICIHAPKSNRKFSPFGARGQMPAIPAMVDLLRHIGKQRGNMEISDEAVQLLERIEALPASVSTPDTRFMHYSERRGQHLLKMCMNQALLCRRMEITVEDVRYCHTLLAYTEVYMADALGEYGFNKDANAQRSILQVLADNPHGCTSQMLLSKCIHFVSQSEDMIQILMYLESAGLIKKVNPVSKGNSGDAMPLYYKVGADLKKWTPQHGVTVFPEYLYEWGIMLE